MIEVATPEDPAPHVHMAFGLPDAKGNVEISLKATLPLTDAYRIMRIAYGMPPEEEQAS